MAYTVVSTTLSQSGQRFIVATRRFRDESAARAYAATEAARTAQIWARYTHAIIVGGPVRGRTLAEYKSNLGETRVVEFA